MLSRSMVFRLGVAALLSWFAGAAPGLAQCPAKTSVADTLYNADGSLASGRVLIAWSTYTIGTCQVVAGQATITVTNGVFNVQLYPNDAATPAGTSYRVTYYLKSGRVTTEYWVVPTSATSVALALVRSPSVPVPAVMFGQAQVTNLVSDLAKKVELPSPCPSGKFLQANGSSTPPQVDCVDIAGGSGSQHQVNATNLASNNPVNFQDTATIAFSNPGAGNVQASVKDASLTADKLSVSSPSSAQLNGVGDANISASAISPSRVAGVAEVQTNKGAANGYASLDGGARVVQDPANAQTAPAAAKIPLSDASGKIADGWLSANVSLLGSAIDLGSEVSGTLPESRGGTNQISYATGDTLYASAANTLSKLAIGGVGRYLRSTGSLPGWSSVPAAGAGSCTSQFVRAVNDNAAPTCATVGKADAASTFVHNDQSNTWTGTFTQDFSASGQTVRIPLKTTPGSPATGEIWINAEQLFYRDNGGTPATRTVVTTNFAQTLSSKTLDNTNSFSGFTDWAEIAAPSNPSAGNVRVYAKSGSGELCSKSSGGVENCMSTGSGGANHNILSATHSDSTAASVARGAGIFGIGATPTWTLVPTTAANRYFKRDSAGDIVESAGAAAGTGTCTDQFVRATNADAAPTCATVQTADLADNVATDTKLRDSAALSVIGRASNTSGDPADIAAATDNQVLRRSGTALGFGAVNLASSDAVTGALGKSNQHAATVYNDQANTYSSGLQDFSSVQVRLQSGSAAPSATACDATGEVGSVYVQSGDPASVRLQVFRCTQTGAASFAWHPISHFTGTTAPATCSNGDLFFDTDATSGQRIYGCEGGSWVLQGDGGGGGANHNLLSTTHPDTSAATVVRGDVVVGNSTPAWARLALGASKKSLVSDGTDAVYRYTQLRSHATDCTSLTDGNEGEACYEQDANTLYICEPTAGGCDTAAEWILVGGGGTATALWSYLLPDNFTNPADSTTYFYASNLMWTASTSDTNQYRLTIPVAGTVTRLCTWARVGGTLGSSENVTSTFRVNGSDSSLSVTHNMDAANEGADCATGSVSVSAGDLVGMKSVTPAWATNPTTVNLGWAIEVTVPVSGGGGGGGGGVPNPGANGMVACTGTNCSTSAARTITGTSGNISVTNGDGVSGNPTIDVGSDIPRVLDRETTDVDVTNTTTETTIFTHSVPANIMNTSRVLNLAIVCDYLNNNATSVTLTLRIKFGGTTIYNDSVAVSAINASRRPCTLNIWLANQGATNDQTGGGRWLLGTAGGATTGIGDIDTDELESTSPIVFADSSIDTTSAQTLEVTVQWSVAATTLSLRRRMAVLQIL